MPFIPWFCKSSGYQTDVSNRSNAHSSRWPVNFSGQNANWRNLLRKSIPLASVIERLAPALAGDGPNAEYPWPRFPNNPIDAPVEFPFPLWAELTETAHGRQFLKLLADLFSVAEAYL